MNLDPDDLSMLPVNPGPEDVLSAYQLCRKKLVKANLSRSSLQGHNKRKKKLILDLQQQLQKLEVGLREETETRIRIHKLNQRVVEIVRDLESGLDQTALIVDQPGGGKLSDWVVKLARLLPVALQLREVKARAMQLLGREASPTIDLPASPSSFPQIGPPAPQPGPESTASPQPEPSGDPIKAPKPPEEQASKSALVAKGPLLLKDLAYAYGLLLLHSKDSPVPEGFRVASSTDWLPGHSLLVPIEPEDELYGPVEAGLLAIRETTPPIAEIRLWLDKGVLPFAPDLELGLLRLIAHDQIAAATHVLVDQDKAAVLEDSGASTFPLDLDGDLEGHWQGFALTSAEDKKVLLQLLRQGGAPRSLAPRLSTRGGVRMAEGQGYLATGLGLPLIAVPTSVEAEAVQLALADGSAVVYEQLNAAGSEEERHLWQPDPGVRRLLRLPTGPARLQAALVDGTTLERVVYLSALPAAVCFRRVQPLGYREDWGLTLGPIALASPPAPQLEPAEASLNWAWQRITQRDYSVNHLFEQQMLEGLAALFQRRGSIPRRDFTKLYAQLRNKPNEWPGFPEAVLRAWCEGGWLEEGLEQSNGRWRIQAIDPRLIRLERGGAQLVGLLTARGLMTVLACAHQLGLEVQSVMPTCADLPRGWRFTGDVDGLAAAAGLPVMEQESWVPAPLTNTWTLEQPLLSDGATWPTGVRGRRLADGICGRRGPEFHWKTAQPLPERYRAPNSLKIEVETSTYGKRRWHSFDPVRNEEFSSCHRNRVALHALIVATDGLWPFGFTDEETGQLDRLYDADAYLPLPIGRYAALTGNRMPGPTRHRPSDHTYRYHFSTDLRTHQSNTKFLPLTTPPGIA